MTIGKKIALGFGFTLAILVVFGFFSYRSTAKLIETNRIVAHTHEVLTDLEALLSLMKDAETGQRGYIITGEERYLEPYQAALVNLNQASKNLRRLVADNPDQQRRLDALEPFIAQKLDELKETIDLRKEKEKGFDAALRVIRTDRGKKAMDDARRIIK